MEDLSNILGVKLTPEQMATLREMERSSQDRYKIHNPTDQDYYVVWDQYGSGGRFVVPNVNRDMGYGMGNAIYPKYIMVKYFKEMSQIILSAKMKQAIDAENADRVAKGFKKMDKTFETEEELRFSDPFRPNQPELLMELLPQLVLGVEEYYGLTPQVENKTQSQVDWEKVQSILTRRPEAQTSTETQRTTLPGTFTPREHGLTSPMHNRATPPGTIPSEVSVEGISDAAKQDLVSQLT